jgi:hypothetical protein
MFYKQEKNLSYSFNTSRRLNTGRCGFTAKVSLTAQPERGVDRPQAVLSRLGYQEFNIPISLGKQEVPGIIDFIKSLPGAHQLRPVGREAHFPAMAQQVEAFRQLRPSG